MNLHLKTASISLQNRADLKENIASQMFHFDVHHSDDDSYLELETGEVFQSPSKNKNAKKENISALLTVGKALTVEFSNKHNGMFYSEAFQSDQEGFPSQIHFQIYLPPDAFGEMVSNTRSGLFPSDIWIGLGYDIYDKSSPVAYGSEPDGSGKKWSNSDKDNRWVKIDKISFDYSLLKPKRDDATGKILEPAASISEIANSFGQEINDRLQSIERATKKVTLAVVGVIVALAIAYLAKH